MVALYKEICTQECFITSAWFSYILNYHNKQFFFIYDYLVEGENTIQNYCIHITSEFRKIKLYIQLFHFVELHVHNKHIWHLLIDVIIV